MGALVVCRRDSSTDVEALKFSWENRNCHRPALGVERGPLYGIGPPPGTYVTMLTLGCARHFVSLTAWMTGSNSVSWDFTIIEIHQDQHSLGIRSPTCANITSWWTNLKPKCLSCNVTMFTSGCTIHFVGLTDSVSCRLLVSLIA